MEDIGEGLILNLIDILIDISFFDQEEMLDVIRLLKKSKSTRKQTHFGIKWMGNQSEDYGRTQVGALVGQGSGGANIGFQAMVEMALKQYTLQAVKMKCIMERSA